MCVWVHRWSICPVYRDSGHFQPSTTPIHNPEKPWLSWRHNQLAKPDLLHTFGLLAPQDFSFVHHRVVSKRRCASWGPRYCNEAPREIHTQLFKDPCSECTGEDRCDSLNVPYRIDVSGHQCLGPEQEAKLDSAVAEYWRCEMLAKIAQLSEFIPVFCNPDADSGSLNPNSSSFFLDLVCVEDLQHVHAIRGETSDCEWCNNINFAPAHNLTRAVRRQEVLSVLKNDADALIRQFDLLGSNENLDNFRKLHGEDRTTQDWCPPEPHWERVNAWHFEIARIGDKLIRQALETSEESILSAVDITQAQNTWRQIIEDRVSLARHVATELSHDPGLSEVFLNKLFIHIASLLLPRPDPKQSRVASDLPEPRSPCHPTTAWMIYNLDRCAGDYRGEIMDAFMRYNSLVICLSRCRDTAVTNSRYAALSIRSDIEACAVNAATAKCSESSCSICLGEWLEASDIPSHLNTVALPCCKKPVHGRCLKPLLRTRAHNPVCPLCRASLVKFGWFGSVFQEQIRDGELVEEGFVPRIMPAPSKSSRDSQLDQAFQTVMEPLVESRAHWADSLIGNIDQSAIQRDEGSGGSVDGEDIDRRVTMAAEDEDVDGARPLKKRRMGP